MPDGLLITVVGLWLVPMILSVWTLRAAEFFGHRMPRVLQRPLEPKFPRVAVILPMKGVDADTPRNVAALLKLDYPNYRLIFAVEAADDPAMALLQRLAETAEGDRIDVVVAGLAERRGQKIHNQLAAVERTDDRDEVLAFIDADAQPSAAWLHALVVPLTYTHIGATTGYRFYVPARMNAASQIVAVINAGVMTLLGPFRRTMAWGGSMAIRRRDFFEYGVHSAWQTAVSDDFVLTWCVKRKANMRIHFVPQCLVASTASFDWASLLEFAVRQYRITRVCVPHVWLAALLGPIFYLAGLLVPLTLAALPGPLGNRVAYAALALLLYTSSVIRGLYLLRAAQRLLPQHWAQTRRSAWWYTALYPLVQVGNLLALAISAFGRDIVWRGTGYTMLSRTETVVHRGVRNVAAPALAARAPY